MFTEEAWKKVRPSSGSNSGIAGGLELWYKHCVTKPADAPNYEALDNAIKACSTLAKAFATALNNMKSDPKATEAINLIKGSAGELSLHKIACEKQIETNRADALNRIVTAEKNAAAGLAEIQKYVTLAKSQKERIDKKVKELGGDPKAFSEEFIKQARVDLTRWKDSLAELAKMIEEKARETRGDTAVAFWRSQGADKICTFCKIPPTDSAKFTDRFQKFTQLMQQIDAPISWSLELASQQAIVITEILAKSYNYVFGILTQIAVYKELQSALENQHKSIKEITLKSPAIGNYGGDANSVDKIFKEQKFEGIKKQRHGAQAQIDQIVDKLEKAKVFKQGIKTLVDNVVNKTTKEEMKNLELKPFFDTVLKKRMEITMEIDDYTRKAEKVVQQVKEYQKLLANPKYK